jgi:hypothetical protein
MNEYYKITQCLYKDGKRIEPTFPLTDMGVLEMMASGIATPLGHEDKEYYAPWGSGIYCRKGKDEYVIVSDNFDTTG